tara:strand:+ start:7034 stop:7288 length:255 start_codon:yes stop_codon:yes gene_type:complete
MSDIGDYWNEIRDAGREKKQLNYKSSVATLNSENISYKKLSDSHLRLNNYDFWPSTGLFIHIGTKKRGRGVFNLINIIKKAELS